MRTIDCPETSARNYHYSLRNNPEERISQDHTTIAHMMSQCVRSREKNVCCNPAAIFSLRGILKDNVYNNNSRIEGDVT